MNGRLGRGSVSPGLVVSVVVVVVMVVELELGVLDRSEVLLEARLAAWDTGAALRWRRIGRVSKLTSPLYCIVDAVER